MALVAIVVNRNVQANDSHGTKILFEHVHSHRFFIRAFGFMAKIMGTMLHRSD